METTMFIGVIYTVYIGMMESNMETARIIGAICYY